MRSKYWLVFVLAFVGLVVSARAASAGPVTLYQVSLDTSGLGGGNFALDFQLNDGSGAGNGNSLLTLSNFNFGGGSANGGPTLSGGATGDTTAGASIIDSSFFNQFLQNFSAGNTLSFTLGSALYGPESPAPDLFTLAILDLDGTGAEIPTLGTFGVEFLSFQSGDRVPQSFGSDRASAFAIGAPTVTSSAVPEPATLLLFATGLAGVIGTRTWRGAFGRKR